MCVCAHIHVCVQLRVLHASLSLSRSLSLSLSLCLSLALSLSLSLFLFLSMCTYIYIYIYICIHTHMQIHIYIYIYIVMCFVYLILCVVRARVYLGACAHVCLLLCVHECKFAGMFVSIMKMEHSKHPRSFLRSLVNPFDEPWAAYFHNTMGIHNRMCVGHFGSRSIRRNHEGAA